MRNKIEGKKGLQSYCLCITVILKPIENSEVITNIETQYEIEDKVMRETKMEDWCGEGEHAGRELRHNERFNTAHVVSFTWIQVSCSSIYDSTSSQV